MTDFQASAGIQGRQFAEQCETVRVRQDLAQILHAPGRKLRRHGGKARHGAAGTREALGDTGTHRIARDRDQDRRIAGDRATQR